jgi:hypothetical protein
MRMKGIKQGLKASLRAVGQACGLTSSGRYAHLFYCFWPQSQAKWLKLQGNHKKTTTSKSALCKIELK